MADIAVLRRTTDRLHLSIVKRGEQLENFGIGVALGAGVIAQQRRPVGLQRGDQAGRGSTQGAQVLGIDFDRLLLAVAERLARLLHPARLAARGATDERDELVVDEQRPRAEPFLPPRIDMARERVFEFRVQLHLHPAADHVVVHHEAAVERGAQHHLARGGMGVERFGILGLEQQAGHLNRGQQRAIAQHQRVLVHQTRIGQPVADAGFLRAPGSSSDPFAHASTLLGRVQAA